MHTIYCNRPRRVILNATHPISCLQRAAPPGLLACLLQVYYTSPLPDHKCLPSTRQKYLFSSNDSSFLAVFGAECVADTELLLGGWCFCWDEESWRLASILLGHFCASSPANPLQLNTTMAAATSELDEQIERLRKGDTLPENEVKALCDKVSVCGGFFLFPSCFRSPRFDISYPLRKVAQILSLERRLSSYPDLRRPRSCLS